MSDRIRELTEGMDEAGVWALMSRNRAVKEQDEANAAHMGEILDTMFEVAKERFGWTEPPKADRDAMEYKFNENN